MAKKQMVTKATAARLLYDFRYNPATHEGCLYITDCRNRAHATLLNEPFAELAMDLGQRIDPDCEKAFVIVLDPFQSCARGLREGGGREWV